MLHGRLAGAIHPFPSLRKRVAGESPPLGNFLRDFFEKRGVLKFLGPLFLLSLRGCCVFSLRIDRVVRLLLLFLDTISHMNQIQLLARFTLIAHDALDLTVVRCICSCGFAGPGGHWVSIDLVGRLLRNRCFNQEGGARNF